MCLTLKFNYYKHLIIHMVDKVNPSFKIRYIANQINHFLKSIKNRISVHTITFA